MEKIISNIYEIIKSADNLIDLEEDLKVYMYHLFTEIMGDVFTQIDRGMKEKKREEGWTVVRSDNKKVNFTLVGITFNHKSMRYTSCVCRFLLVYWLDSVKSNR